MSEHYVLPRLEQQGYARAWKAELGARSMMENPECTFDNRLQRGMLKGSHAMKLSVVAVKEFFRCLGFKSSEEIFAVESGFRDFEYSDILPGAFKVTDVKYDQTRFPVLTLAYIMYRREVMDKKRGRECPIAEEGEAMQVMGGVAENRFADCTDSRCVRPYSHVSEVSSNSSIYLYSNPLIEEQENWSERRADMYEEAHKPCLFDVPKINVQRPSNPTPKRDRTPRDSGKMDRMGVPMNMPFPKAFMVGQRTDPIKFEIGKPRREDRIFLKEWNTIYDRPGPIYQKYLSFFQQDSQDGPQWLNNQPQGGSYAVQGAAGGSCIRPEIGSCVAQGPPAGNACFDVQAAVQDVCALADAAEPPPVAECAAKRLVPIKGYINGSIDADTLEGTFVGTFAPDTAPAEDLCATQNVVGGVEVNLQNSNAEVMDMTESFGRSHLNSTPHSPQPEFIDITRDELDARKLISLEDLIYCGDLTDNRTYNEDLEDVQGGGACSQAEAEQIPQEVAYDNAGIPNAVCEGSGSQNRTIDVSQSPRLSGSPRSPRPSGSPRSPRSSGSPRSPRPSGSPRLSGSPRSPRPSGSPRSPRPSGSPRSPRPSGSPRSSGNASNLRAMQAFDRPDALANASFNVTADDYYTDESFDEPEDMDEFCRDVPPEMFNLSDDEDEDYDDDENDEDDDDGGDDDDDDDDDGGNDDLVDIEHCYVRELDTTY